MTLAHAADAKATTSHPKATTSHPAHAISTKPTQASLTLKPHIAAKATGTKAKTLTLAHAGILHGHRAASNSRSRFICNYPVDHSGTTQHGVAVYYGTGSAAWRQTASGEPLDPRGLTAASPTLPIGSQADITNIRTGQQLRVTITDRGPYGPGLIVDVTPAVAEQLGMMISGHERVEIRPVKETLD